MSWNKRIVTTGGLVFCMTIMIALESIAAMPKGSVSGGVIEYGIYEYSGPKQTVASHGTATGTVSFGSPENVKLLTKTNVIPLQKGIIFGYKWRIEGLKGDLPVDITCRVKHPPIINQKGISSEKSEGIIRVTPSGGVFEMIYSYKLSEDHEMVPGVWTFTIHWGKQLIAEMSFHVVAK